ncbi:MAG TPA: hypothetical protein VLE74_03410 [Candidatus Saccharimonadales bacterium]|nr:hypothetical protein [Candidatus Saccharimonadales bacterium]
MRYGIVVLIIIFFAIVGTIVLIGSTNKNTSSAKTARVTKLVDYENKDGSTITWTQQGRLLGEDQRKAIRVTVTRNKRTVEILSGYEERVERSEDFTNSPAAFSTFVRALDNANFGRERTVKQPDERGICPTGNRFVYRLTDNGSEVMRTWSDTCASADGPFGGAAVGAQLMQQLFKAQITDYQKFTSGVIL